MKLQRKAILAIALFATLPVSQAAGASPQQVRSAVDEVIRPLMEKDHIPGMAVGVIVEGKSYVFNYGLASTRTHKPVTNATLFELGSVSKTFTATLATYAQVSGHLSLSDTTSQYLPALKGHPFGHVSLLELGTHTPGGLPLQVPDRIKNNNQLMQYFQQWHPTCAPGTCRTYTNIGIGTLGLITAGTFSERVPTGANRADSRDHQGAAAKQNLQRSQDFRKCLKCMGESFDTLMEQRLFPALGITGSYIHVPQGKMADYAQGYTSAGAPIRVAPGVLSSEAYGIKATATDLIHFIALNMNSTGLEKKLRQAIAETHIGYFRAGDMTQDLIWEQYPYPVPLNVLLKGNSAAMAFHAIPVQAIQPPQKPGENVWINKTGSTNGFGAYVAFIPGKQMGIAILANKNYPTNERVTAGYRILTSLSGRERK